MQCSDMYAAVSAIVDPVFLVGGSVRDRLMGRDCSDYDFATPLEPDRVEELIRAAGRRPYLVGKRFGTVALRLDGRVIEITTFRSEAYEEFSRKPRVEFLRDLAEDLRRRDFTVNAIAMRGDGEVIDPWGGRADIDGRVIRAVGDPGARFREDALRMLRAARFAAQLEFTVEPGTVAAMERLAPRILHVARERWVQELDRLLVGLAATDALRLLAETGLLRCMLPELQLQLESDLFARTLAAVDSAPADVTARWAALLGEIAEPYRRAGRPAQHAAAAGHDLLGGELVERIGLYLKWSNDRREAVKALVRDRQALAVAAKDDEQALESEV
ncbi:MAG: hypothetical protein HGA39_05320 [Coriobacteriia bacterium]|nr:hypothetical protein [Coriobacteriia bacterium]